MGGEANTTSPQPQRFVGAPVSVTTGRELRKRMEVHQGRALLNSTSPVAYSPSESNFGLIVIVLSFSLLIVAVVIIVVVIKLAKGKDSTKQAPETDQTAGFAPDAAAASQSEMSMAEGSSSGLAGQDSC